MCSCYYTVYVNLTHIMYSVGYARYVRIILIIHGKIILFDNNYYNTLIAIVMLLFSFLLFQAVQFLIATFDNPLRYRQCHHAQA